MSDDRTDGETAPEAGSERDVEFGPGGYLPPRAAQRARKIILRAPLGIGWVVASVATGVVLLAVGLVLLRGSSAPPEPPFAAVGAIPPTGEAVHHQVDGRAVLVVNAGGLRALDVEDHPTVDACAAGGRLESADGRVFSLTGRALDGGASLAEHPLVLHDGVVYVDPTRTRPPVPGADEGVEPACP